VFTLGLAVLITPAAAQYFQFSQYNFTPQRINPALVASSDYAQVAFVYRNQGTDGGFRLNSNSLNAMYPLQSRQGKRWSGIGVSLLDDRSGQAGIFVTQEAGLAYAINIFVASNQSLALGVKALYQGRRIDLGGLYTGSQYIPDRGFDELLSPGENFGELKSDVFTFSLGLHYQKEDKDGMMVGYWDISFFDFNRPEEHFITPSTLNPTLVAAGGFRLYRGEKMSVFPQILYTRSATNNIVNAGAIFRYDLVAPRQRVNQYLDFITTYVFGRSAVLGVQFNDPRFALGVSYDFPAFNHNVANTGAVEVGLVLRKEVIKNSRARREKERKKKTSDTTGQQPKRLSASVGVRKPRTVNTRDSSNVASQSNMSERLRQKQDSIAAQGRVGIIQHDPLILEKATLRFNFEFNSATPGADARGYLEELVSALKDNPDLRLQLVGHTDNVGSDKFNLRLSLSRAQAFKDYVVQHGIDASRITVDGKGMREPLNSNGTPEERAMNRRVEMTILYDH
jgi:type IX secretion system PorP/SprF family membrane protein